MIFKVSSKPSHSMTLWLWPRGAWTLCQALQQAKPASMAQVISPNSWAFINPDITVLGICSLNKSMSFPFANQTYLPWLQTKRSPSAWIHEPSLTNSQLSYMETEVQREALFPGSCSVSLRSGTALSSLTHLPSSVPESTRPYSAA